MEFIPEVLKDYGGFGLLLVVLVYVLLKGEFVFRYPRSQDKPKQRK